MDGVLTLDFIVLKTQSTRGSIESIDKTSTNVGRFVGWIERSIRPAIGPREALCTRREEDSACIELNCLTVYFNCHAVLEINDIRELRKQRVGWPSSEPPCYTMQMFILYPIVFNWLAHARPHACAAPSPFRLHTIHSSALSIYG